MLCHWHIIGQRSILNWYMYFFSPSWEVELFRLYARLAHHNIGRIDWEPYNEIIFTRYDHPKIIEYVLTKQ